MCNWFKKLFGAKKCCGNCGKKEEKADSQVTQPIAPVKPIEAQMENAQKDA